MSIVITPNKRITRFGSCEWNLKTTDSECPLADFYLSLKTVIGQKRSFTQENRRLAGESSPCTVAIGDDAHLSQLDQSQSPFVATDAGHTQLKLTSSKP